MEKKKTLIYICGLFYSHPVRETGLVWGVWYVLSRPRILSTCPRVSSLLIGLFFFSFRDSGKMLGSMILLIPLKDNQEKA